MAKLDSEERTTIIAAILGIVILILIYCGIPAAAIAAFVWCVKYVVDALT